MSSSSSSSVSIPVAKRVVSFTPANELEQANIPTGSPSFDHVMHDLAKDFHKIRYDDDEEAKERSVGETTRSKQRLHHHRYICKEDENPLSPIQARKLKRERDEQVSGRPWSRTASWNLRSKRASEKRDEIQRKQMEKWTKNVKQSPTVTPKRKSNRMSNNHQDKVEQPAYRFQTESISVSHDDLVNERLQTRGAHRDREEEIDSQSIFHTPKIYRRFTMSRPVDQYSLDDSDDSD